MQLALICADYHGTRFNRAVTLLLWSYWWYQVSHGNEHVEKLFVEEAEAESLINLAGHRSCGGCRASIYNGMSLEGVEKLLEFMKVLDCY